MANLEQYRRKAPLDLNQYKRNIDIPEEPINFEVPESTGMTGVIQDASSIPMNLLQYAMSLPQKTSESIGQLDQNKTRALQNLLVGATNFAKGTINLPYDINQYLTKKNLLPEFAQKYGKLIPHIPEETGLQKAFIGDEQPGDEVLQLLPQLLMGKPFARAAASEIPLSKKFAAINLKDASRMVKQSNVKGLNVSHDIIDDVANFLKEAKFPSSESALNQLIEKAKQGDYDALFALQSDAEKAARSLTKSASGTERNQGLAGYAKRENLLDKFRESLKEQGHENIARKMKKGQKKYRQYHKIDENIYRHLRKLGIPLSVLGAVELAVEKILWNKDED